MAARRILPVLQQRCTEDPVVALHGPRSVGKSTLLRAFADVHNVPVVDLDEPATLDAASANTSLVVAGASPVCIDEYQREPDLLDAIKALLNRTGNPPGTAVLTGSTRHDAIPRTAQALTGRLHVLTVLPLSQGEIDGKRENLLEALLADPEEATVAHPTSATSRNQYVERVCAGGFPLALRRSGDSRARWFRDYTRLSVERDAVELGRVRQREALAKLLSLVGGQTAQVLNLSTAQRKLGLDWKTAEAYTRLLEDLFLIRQVPAWGATLRSRTGKKPKAHVVDSGLAAWLMGVSEARLGTADPAALSEFGHLLETFVVGELHKHISWLDHHAAIYHWRAGDHEVDAVVEFDDGRVIAFEVKANERIRRADLAALAALRDLVGDRFVAGVALSTGSRSYRSDEERVHVMPVDRLWQPCP